MIVYNVCSKSSEKCASFSAPRLGRKPCSQWAVKMFTRRRQTYVSGQWLGQNGALDQKVPTVQGRNDKC